ncbi:unnamed protein product [Symbiodinium sp. CCMP2592]|nr:unnamed protein product [Symbiodinium sp. CCMP2592]
MSPESSALVKDLSAQLGEAEPEPVVEKEEASSSSGPDAQKTAVLEQTIKELQRKFHEKEKELQASKKNQPPAAATGETADVNQQASEEPEDDDGDGCGNHPEVSQARQQLRRFCKRRANGSLLVPEDVHNKFWSGGAERAKLLTLFLKNGRDKSMFLKEVKVISEKEKKMEMQIAGDYYELWELRDIKKADIYNPAKIRYWYQDTMRASFSASQLLREREEVSYEQEVAEHEGVVTLGQDFDFAPGAPAMMEDLGLPNLSDGQQPEDLLMTYVNGLMVRSSKMSDMLCKIEALADAPDVIKGYLALSCLVRVQLGFMLVFWVTDHEVI